MQYCPFCGEKLEFVATCVFKCEHKFEEYPDKNMVLIFVTNREKVAIHSLENLTEGKKD